MRGHNWLLATGDVRHFQHETARCKSVMFSTEGSGNILLSSGKYHLKLS
jgi:hypothetical protein